MTRPNMRDILVACVALLALAQPMRAIPDGPPPRTPDVFGDPEPSDVQPGAFVSRWTNLVDMRPYGSLWANMFYATQRTFPGEFTFWVFSADDQGEDAFSLDARRTRIGLDIRGPQFDWLGGVETAGQLEIDFLGEFVTENRAGARLRHAWWEAQNEDHRVLVGQTWDVVSPLRPGTLNFSVGWNAGNIGFRRAQLRLERFVKSDVGWDLTLQASANQDIVADFPTEPGVRRESADWPVLQARAATSFSPSNDTTSVLAIGLSGHIGETGFDFLTSGPPPTVLPPEDDVRLETWSWNIDVEVRLSDNVSIQGEFFTGANLSPFFGGIGQGVCPCLRRPIRSTGGWLDVKLDWHPGWESHVGAGIDDPSNEDSLFGRTRNEFVFVNIIRQFNAHLHSGLELSWWRTEYHETRDGVIDPSPLTPDAPGNAITLDWMVRYDF